MMLLEAAAIEIVKKWHGELSLYQDKLPSKGSIAAALVVLGRLRTSYNLDVSAHVAGGQAQITGLSAASLMRTLAEFGETRPLSTVGGRSNRGARGDVEALLRGLRTLNLDSIPEDARNGILAAMQRHIVTEYVTLYFNVKRVKAAFDPSAATCRYVRGILENAHACGKAGAVAEYLVGAKLALRFPGKAIRNKRFSTSDAQGGYSGDFEVGNTVFHVTVAPMLPLFDKCRENLNRGLRVYLLVPDSQVAGARQNAENYAAGRIAVESIESFIATNVDELSEFDGQKVVSGLCRLLQKYNERVEAVELDKSMLIDIPPNVG